MNASPLFAWLRRQISRRPASSTSKRPGRIHSPELLEPRTVLSAFGLAHFGLVHVGGVSDAPPRGHFGRPTELGIERWDAPHRPAGSFAAPSRPVTAAPVAAAPLTVISAFVSNRTTPVFGVFPAPSASAGLERAAVGIVPLANRAPAAVATTAPSTFYFQGITLVIDAARLSALNIPGISGDRILASRPTAAPSREPATPLLSARAAGGSLPSDGLTVDHDATDGALAGDAAVSLLSGPAAELPRGRADAHRQATQESGEALPDDAAPAGSDDDAAHETDLQEGLVELEGGPAHRRPRKPTTSGKAAQAPVSAHLARFAELPALRAAQPMLRELAQFARDAVLAAQQSPTPHFTEQPDDGLLELLAADIGPTALPAAGAAAAAPSVTVRLATLDAAIALYQAFEWAVAEDVSSADAAVIKSLAAAAIAPAPDRLE